jgi:hypothetical protein
MQRDTFRYLILITLLALGAGASLLLRANRAQPQSRVATTITPQQVFYIDLAGWYETTPDEKAVASPYDLRPTALATSLPLELGDWKGESLGTDPDIETWYAQPDFVLRRQYLDHAGHLLWITAISSSGPKSFKIFEHTPPICYSSTHWDTLSDDIRQVTLRQGTVALRRGIFEQGGTRHVVYYWYQWDDLTRDAGKGVTTWRLIADASDSVEAAETRLQGLVGLLFTEVLPWHRF